MQFLALTTLRDLAARCGLSVLGVTGADRLQADLERLRSWQERGLAAGMTYMLRPPELLASPAAVVPGARSVITVALFYDRTPVDPLPAGHGRVARYAWGRDYHKVLRKRLEALVDLVRAEVGAALEARVFSDSVPLLERALGSKAGLGFVGKSSMLIIPGKGTFFFLGELLSNLEVQLDEPAAEPRGRHCGSCKSCLTECPTQAFVGERVLDAGRCISYLTIEKRGALVEAERRMIGDWLFGCDVCQEVCPFNFVSLKKGRGAEVPELGAEAGVGPSLALGELLSIRETSAFQRRFSGTALMRAKREGLLRNASVVAANRRVEELEGELLSASMEDSSGMVRQHALWAYVELVKDAGSSGAARAAARLARALSDPDAGVSAEAKMLLSRLPN